MRTKGFKGVLLSTLAIATLMASVVSLLSPSTVHAGLTSHAPISINGDNQFDNTHGVDGGGNGTADNPYIIENWSISAGTAQGIVIRNTTAYFVIRNCLVENGGGTYDGIYFENVRNGKIDGVKSENNYIGINIYCSSNIIIENSTTLNNPIGISFSDSLSNVVENCTVSNNSSQGIHLGDSPGNTIANSTIENNSVGVWSTGINSENNRICHNSFENNEDQAYDEVSNYWDNGYPSGGNYWSDYAGVDMDNDGIGDTPYYILGDNNRDRYPLMNPWSPPEIPWAGSATFKLENLYKVSLNKDLQLYTGSKLVVKFYDYGNNPENEVVIENITPPENVKENENVPHPSGLVPVEIVRLVLTSDNTEEVISIIASFTVTKSKLAGRYLEIKNEYVQLGADRPALAAEYLKIKSQYVKAP